jgi:hypothetical protein
MKDREKQRQYDRKWRIANREKKRASSIRWAKENRDRANAIGREWRARNGDKLRAYRFKHSAKRAVLQKAWRQRNPFSRALEMSKLRAIRRRAYPVWANRFVISEIYHLARLRTRFTGIQWEVDHRVPLQHPLVCGLHVEHNLRVIPKNVNRAKRNYLIEEV